MKTFTIGLALVLAAGTAMAGRSAGPTYKTDTVLAKSSRKYSILFQGNEPARIIVNGDRSSDLDCVVLDDNGNTVVSDTDLTDVCVLYWEPTLTGRFELIIRNRGSVANEYLIKTN